jgi:hypothetical protein
MPESTRLRQPGVGELTALVGFHVRCAFVGLVPGGEPVLREDRSIVQPIPDTETVSTLFYPCHD